MESQTIANILRTLAATGIWISLIFLAYSPGRKILKILKIRNLDQLNRIIIAISLGLGIISFGIFLFGIAGLFRPWLMVFWIFIPAIWSRHELIFAIKNIPTIIGSLLNIWKNANYQGKGFIIISSIILFITYLQALTPPWDYDGLTYHLEAPRQYLLAGRILLIPEIYQANGPMLTQMIYSLGVGVGLDQLAKLIHLIYGILLILATFSLGERYLGNNKGWMPAAILIGTPIVVVLAGLAYIDLAWGLYTLLSVYSILIWREVKLKSWLVLAGVMTGFMIGTKYFALGYLIIFSIMLLWFERKSDRSTIFGNLLLFVGIAFLIGIPWYLKNLIWTRNPIYPLIFGGPGWPVERVKISSIYTNSFGTGRSFWDFLLLPIYTFIHQENFSTYLGGLETLNPLWLLVIFFPFLKEKSTSLVIIFVITILGFLYWYTGSWQIRLMMPLFGLLSFLTAKILDSISLRIPSKRLKRIFIPGIIGGFLIFSSLVSVYLFFLIRPLGPVIGQETREEFLTRLSDKAIGTFNAMRFIQLQVPANKKVLMVWEGQSYYCNGRCIPDTDYSLWTYLVHSTENTTTLSMRLYEMGVTHLLVNASPIYLDDPDFIEDWNQSSLHRDAYLFLVDRFIPDCTKEVYRDQLSILFELTCIHN